MLKRTEEKERLVGLDNAGSNRQGRWLVRGVSFEIKRGEIVTLIGPNGSGKSTSARMALGLVRPDEGLVTTRSDLRVGYVPQKMSIDRTMPLTVERLMTLTGSPSRKEVADALAETGIAHLAKAEVQHLSGGEFQRALLARAIARKPDLLVLDEPVQGVDYNGEIALYELIGEIRDRSGCGVLLISHDLHVVMAATDTVVCLNGHVCCTGTPEMVSQSAEYQRLFGVRGSGALAIYTHHHDHTHLPDGRVLHQDGSVTDSCHPDDGHHHGHDHQHGADCSCGHDHSRLVLPKTISKDANDA
ncbi:metal ABC transporter ATP-binding protein [Rhizobium sp. KVB221]|uniref:Metal ABC transporter ATP-binding protein n=1 Tax=Rhizobium setariae TaxID=2801340 RepID=A0A936YU26_9HYPH|nr:metal ABC transporter ATP-binding protein [Rhizobium setariae]MBL0373126.1 metal ABC transporter ATP-binding protein [Rhizobium setariae]